MFAEREELHQEWQELWLDGIDFVGRNGGGSFAGRNRGESGTGFAGIPAVVGLEELGDVTRLWVSSAKQVEEALRLRGIVPFRRRALALAEILQVLAQAGSDEAVNVRPLRRGGDKR